MTSRTRSTSRTSTKTATPTSKSQRPKTKAPAAKSAGRRLSEPSAKKAAKVSLSPQTAAKARSKAKTTTAPKGNHGVSRKPGRPSQLPEKRATNGSLRPKQAESALRTASKRPSLPTKSLSPQKRSVPAVAPQGRGKPSKASGKQSRNLTLRGRGAATSGGATDPRQLALPFSGRPSKAPAKRADAKRADAKRADAKRADAKRADAKRADAKRADAKRADAKRADAKRADAKRADAKRADAKRADAKRADAKRADAKRADAKRADAKRADAKRADAKRADAKKQKAATGSAGRSNAPRAAMANKGTPSGPLPTSSSPVPFSMSRLKERIEQEQVRRKQVAERAQDDTAPDSTVRALPVGVRRGRLSPRGERSEILPPSSPTPDFDALDRYLAGAGVVVESNALRSYLLPWLNGTDVLAFVPADRSALIGCCAVALANRKKALIVLASEESVTDQVLMLKAASIDVATLASNPEDRATELSRLGGETAYVLVVSLERLLIDDVLDECRKLSFDLLAVDESQRVSELAPDFDPGLERLADLAPRLGRPPTLALLRAVPPSVRSDLPHRLGLRNPLRIDLPPVHDALALEVVATDQHRRTGQVVELLSNSLLPAVVLGYSMADVNDVVTALGNAGMDARRYEPTARQTLQDLSAQAVWVVPTGRVTTPVQFAHTLVHFRSPPSLEQYCRDLGWVVHTSGHARSIMFVASDDESMVKGTLDRQRPRAEDLIGIAGVLVRHGSNSSTVLLDSLCPAVGMNRARVESLVGIFARTGWVDHAQDWIRLRPDCPDLVERARGLGARLKTAKERDAQRLRSVSAYVVSRGCRQESLRRHFGTAGSRPCGLCDACVAGRAVAAQPSSGRSVDEGNSPVSRAMIGDLVAESPVGDKPAGVHRRRLIHF